MTHKLQYTHPPEEMPDSWHLHTADEGPPQTEHGRTNAAILSVAFLASFGFVAVVILVSYLYFQVEIVKRREARIETTVLGKEAREYKAKSLQELQNFGFASPQAARAGVVSLPVSEAQRRVMERYGKAAPAAGGSR